MVCGAGPRYDRQTQPAILTAEADKLGLNRCLGRAVSEREIPAQFGL